MLSQLIEDEMGVSVDVLDEHEGEAKGGESNDKKNSEGERHFFVFPKQHSERGIYSRTNSGGA